MSLLTIVGLEHTGHHLWEPLLEKTFGKSEMANLYWYLSLISRQPINETLLAQKLHEDTLVSDPSGKELHRRMQEAHHSTGAGGSRSPRGRRFDPDHLKAAPHMSRFLQTNVTRALVTSYHVSNRSATARASLEAAGLHRTQSWHAYVACTNRIHKETSHMKEDLHM
mmetsp:Transcript_34346/g.72320  ORF Transcript_34346/g.72320 Transcript_34346/m.72320 type:complete len:167 (-) Transcript_34346:692-1192(-)